MKKLWGWAKSRLGGRRMMSTNARASSSQEVRSTLQIAVATDVASNALRHYLDRYPGAENLEFLLAYRSLVLATNPLQRNQHLERIVHRFVKPDAPRRVGLGSYTLRLLLREAGKWLSGGRLPYDAQLPVLHHVASQLEQRVRRGELSGQISGEILPQGESAGHEHPWSDTMPLEDSRHSPSTVLS